MVERLLHTHELLWKVKADKTAGLPIYKRRPLRPWTRGRTSVSSDFGDRAVAEEPGRAVKESSTYTLAAGRVRGDGRDVLAVHVELSGRR